MTEDIPLKRLAKYRSVLDQEGLDALLIANYADSGTTVGFDHNLTYLTGLNRTYPNSFLLLTNSGYYLCVDRFEQERAQDDSWLPDAHSAPIIGYPPDEFVNLICSGLDRLGAGDQPHVGVNARKLPSSIGLLLGQRAKVRDVSLTLEKARVVKDTWEIEAIARACQIAEVGVQTILSAITEGITELELAAVAEYEMSKQGAECFWAGRTMVMTGPDAVSVVGTDSSTGRRVSRGDLVHIDVFPSYQGYMADIARSIMFGSPTQEQQDLADVTFAAFQRAVGALHAGNTVKDIKDAAFKDVHGTRYEGIIRGPGHGMGLNDDLYPRLGLPANEGILLEDGMVISIEVYTMLPGVGGVRYEDNLVVRGSDPIRLTTAKKLLIANS